VLVALVVLTAVGACGTRAGAGGERTVSTGQAPASTTTGTLTAHPQAIEPAAGAVAPSFAPSAPVGNPNAHAPSLAEVKQELKILNLCGGATSSAFAQPLVKSAGPGFVADPGTSQSQGQLPVLTARLDALAKALGVVIYGISGYRTPAHSVAVGGFANDPHTRGQAEDIGVNSLLRSSAARISEAQLGSYGLYRPFDPSNDPSNSEVNHIQLIPTGGALSLAQATTSLSPDPRCR
jgi:hypothetical protein